MHHIVDDADQQHEGPMTLSTPGTPILQTSPQAQERETRALRRPNGNDDNLGKRTNTITRHFRLRLASTMLDDGASACITNDEEDFIEPPPRVDRTVEGIKGHANATHRGTLK